MKERIIFLRDTEEAHIWGDQAEECVCLQPGDVENLWKNREGESCFGFFFLFLHSQFRGTLGLLTSINVLLDPYVSTNSTHWKPHLAKDHRGIKSQVLPYLRFLIDLLPKNRSEFICNNMHLLSVEHKDHYRSLSMNIHQCQNFMISFW